MPGRILLIDSDVFVLLAASGLLDRVLSALGCSRAEARRLDALPHMARKNKKWKAKYDAQTLAKVEAEAITIPAITDQLTAETMALLKEVDGIDYGEAVLYGLLFEQDVMYLASNDKRAMRAVCSSVALKDLRDGVAGRIVCLESILAAILPTDGVPQTADKLAPILHADTMLQVVFTRHNIDHPESALAAVRSYLDALKRELGDDFLYTL